MSLQAKAKSTPRKPRGNLWTRVRRSERVHYYLMFLPALLLLMGVLYPFLLGVFQSFTNLKLYLPTTSFVGLQNYLDLFADGLFQQSILQTLLYAVLVIALQIPLGIAVALLLDIQTPFRALARNTLVLPLLIPPVVAGLMWKTMMQPAGGVLNWLLKTIGLPALPWLTEPATALMSVVLIDTWVFMPFVALILLAGLQSIPSDMMEAAKVDGATEWQAFWYLKLPWLTPYILLVMLFRVADAIKTFELIYPTTRGGPLDATRVLHVLGYQEAFRWSSVGRAMAIIFVLWLLSYTISTILMRLWRKRSEVIQGA